MRNNLKLFHSTSYEIFHLIQNFFHRTRYMPPRNNRNSAIRTFAVASFRYFQICIMPGSGQCTLYVQFIMICLAQIPQQFFPVELAVKLVNLRNFNGQFFQITFRQAAHDIEFLQTPFFLGLRKFKNHINGLFLCITDETASINYRNLSFRTFGIMRHMKTRFFQLTHQMLRIHQIFRTT